MGSKSSICSFNVTVLYNYYKHLFLLRDIKTLKHYYTQAINYTQINIYKSFVKQSKLNYKQVDQSVVFMSQ